MKNEKVFGIYFWGQEAKKDLGIGFWTAGNGITNDPSDQIFL